MAATLKIPTIFTAVDKFSSVMRTMTKSVRSWSNKSIASVRRFDQKITKSFRKLSSFAQIGLGLGIGLIFREGLKAITDFETGLVGVGKTTGIEGGKLKELGFDILGLSKSLRGVSSVELLELAQVAGQMGIQSSKDILKFTKVFAKLQKTTDIQGAEGAQDLVRILQLTGDGIAGLDKFAGAMVILGNETNTTEAQILSVASEVAKGSKAYDFSSKLVLSLAAAFEELGIRPQKAGTGLFETVRAISLATSKGGKVLNKFASVIGISAKEVKENFKLSKEETFLSFIKGLARLRGEGKDVNAVLKDLGLGGSGVAKSIGGLAGNYERLNKIISLTNDETKVANALQNEFGASTKTINVGLSEITKSFNNLLTEEALQGDTLNIIRKALFFVADNMGLIVSVAAILIGSYVAMKVALIATTIVSAAYNIGLGIMSALSGTASIAVGKNAIALGAYKIALAISTAAQWLFNAAMLANPIVLIIIAVIVAIAAIIFAFKNWDKITAWFSNQWKKFTSFISDAWGNIVNFFKEFDFKNFFKAIGQSILSFLLLPMKGVLSLLSKIPGKIGRLAKTGLEKIGEITGDVNIDGSEKNPVLDSPEVSASKTTTENIQKNNIMLEIRDKGNNVESIESTGDLDIPIKLTGTQGAT